jgi:hypothetical protein
MGACPPLLSFFMLGVYLRLLLSALLIVGGIAWAVRQARSGTRVGVVAAIAAAALGTALALIPVQTHPCLLDISIQVPDRSGVDATAPPHPPEGPGAPPAPPAPSTRSSTP